MSNLVVVVLWFFWSYRMILKKELYLQVPSIIRTSFKFGLNRLQIKSANSMQTRHTVLYSWHNHVYRWFIPLFIGFIGFQPSVWSCRFLPQPSTVSLHPKKILSGNKDNKVPSIPILIISHHFSSFFIIFYHFSLFFIMKLWQPGCGHPEVLIHESWAQDRCTGHQDVLRP